MFSHSRRPQSIEEVSVRSTLCSEVDFFVRQRNMAPSDWDTLFLLNARTAFLTSAAAERVMKATSTRGRLITIGARAALAGGQGLAAYSASKAAVSISGANYFHS